ncbi:MAG TPA: hypothetical protein VFZ16_02290 [Hyphomicrobiaceae bacterium]|nr:hypothetical protein [Hyphomicrobiaceae bacterium]
MGKHKLSFQEANRVFDDPLVLIEQGLSEDYGETDLSPSDW